GEINLYRAHEPGLRGGSRWQVVAANALSDRSADVLPDQNRAVTAILVNFVGAVAGDRNDRRAARAVVLDDVAGRAARGGDGESAQTPEPRNNLLHRHSVDPVEDCRAWGHSRAESGFPMWRGQPDG